MTEYYQVPILELLTIPNAEKRWVLIKKALAADANQQDTKAIEFAYRKLETAEQRLIRINEESTEFINVPIDLEPADDADRYSDGPKLLAFAKKHGVRHYVRSVADFAKEYAEAVDEGADDEVEVVQGKGTTETTSQVADEPATGEHVTTERAVEKRPSPEKVDEMPVFAATDTVSTEDTVAKKDETMSALNDDLAEKLTENDKALKPEAQMTEERTFTVDLDAVLKVQDPRARWIMLKKLVAFVRKRKHVRSLSSADLGNEDNAVAVLREHGTDFVIPVDAEPKDKSDDGSSPVSLRDFSIYGWTESPSAAAAPSSKLNSGQKKAAAKPVPESGNVSEVLDEKVTSITVKLDRLLDENVADIRKDALKIDAVESREAVIEVIARRLELEAANIRLWMQIRS